MKIKLLLTGAVALLTLGIAQASDFEVKGTTSGSGGTNGFDGGPSATLGGLTYTDGAFDVFTAGGFAAIGGTSTQNLGEFSLTTAAFTYTGHTFTMTVTFTAPPGAGSGTYDATLTGKVVKKAGGVQVTWTSPTKHFTFPGGAFDLTVNNVAITAGQSSFVTGFISNASVPDGGSAVALLGIALTGIEAGRRLIRARKA